MTHINRSGLTVAGAVLGFGLVTAGCNSHDAHKAEAEIKKDAKDLASKVDAAVKPDQQSASSKVSDGMDKMKTATSQAGVKLDQAASLARVKTQLASKAGMATLGNIDVTVEGREVTLRGSVDSSAERKAAEETASQVDGVTEVHNRLIVKP